MTAVEQSTQMNGAAEVPKPYTITDPSQVLTDEVIRNLRVVFQQFELPINEAYVRIAGGGWRPVSLDDNGVSAQAPAFCAYLRNKAPFSALCLQDREQFCNKVIQAARDGVRTTEECPFGLRLLGFTFRVGQAEVVFRSRGLLEEGNEGLAINRAIAQLTQLGQNSERNSILPLFADHPQHTDAEFRRDSEKVNALIRLVAGQADQEYQRKVEESKVAFLDDLGRLVVPLMTEFVEQKEKETIREALSRICEFFSLKSCAFYFSEPESPDWLAPLAAIGTESRVMPKLRADSVISGEMPSVGSVLILPPSMTNGATKSKNKRCILSYPPRNLALLDVVLASPEDLLLDERTLGELTRLLSLPICVASLQSGLKREADLRISQARNTAHTVGSHFEGIQGDVAVIQQGIQSGADGMLEKAGKAAEHLEELVSYIGHLLEGQKVIESRFLPGTRQWRIGEKKRLHITRILMKARECFKQRARFLNISIDLQPSLFKLDEVEVNEPSLSLACVLLLDNALKYSHRGAPGNPHRIEVEGRQEASWIHISFEDFGIGIHPLEDDKIFKPYVQGSTEDKTREITGQGIGLAAAREIAQFHGGDVILKQCIPHRHGKAFSRRELLAYQPGSPQAFELLQRCLVVFDLSLPLSNPMNT